MKRSKTTLGAQASAQRLRLGGIALVAGACTLALLLSAHTTTAATLRGHGHSRPTAAAVNNNPHGTFTIAGSVGGLYPGASAQLVLTVSNPQPFAIDVTSITTTVGNPSASCSASNLTVAAFSGNLTVPGRGSAKVTVPVALSHAAPDACQGVEFPLTYNGLAQKV